MLLCICEKVMDVAEAQGRTSDIDATFGMKASLWGSWEGLLPRCHAFHL